MQELEREWEDAPHEEEAAPEREDLPEEGAPPIPPEEEGGKEEASAATPDYAAWLAEDYAAICRLRPEYIGAGSLLALPFAERFARFRDLGLSAEEALAAADPIHTRPRSAGKEHLRTIAPRAGGERSRGMTHSEMEAARNLFGEKLSDREIADLYRRATK